MPIQLEEVVAATEGGAIDAYLHLQTARGGKIKGEATADGHTDDIEIQTWSLGLDSSSAIDSVAATGRRSYTHFTFTKSVDRSTTALLSSTAFNDEVREARLMLRRAGVGQQDYFKVTLKNARIVSLHLGAGSSGETVESIAIAFRKIEVEYTPQGATGQRGGTTTFTDEVPNR